MNKTIVAVAAGSLLTISAAIGASAAGAHNRSARAPLSTADGSKIGSVQFRTERDHTEVRVRLDAAPGLAAFHGFHIHANDVPANGEGCVADPGAAPSTWFVSADGHFNPTGQGHGHHLGDLPVVYVNADGSVETRFAIDTIKPADLEGRAVILHAGADNYANIPIGSSGTQYTANSPDAVAATGRTGNAGDRLACGVISTR